MGSTRFATLAPRLVVVSALLAATGCAMADTVSISGNSGGSTDGLGSFSGSLTYQPLTASTGKITISLTNTTSASLGGYITGVVFNLPSGGSAPLFSTTNANFFDTGSESASPFGTFDAGAALGANWSGGGSPSGGIAVGQSATFVFNLSAAGAGSLSALSFIGQGDSIEMVVRFRGFANGASDKVPTVLIPAPATAALAGAGVLALAARRRRR